MDKIKQPPPPDCSRQSLDKGPRQRSSWLEKAALGHRFVRRGVGEELVQEEGLLTSQHEHRLSETGPASTDLQMHEESKSPWQGIASFCYYPFDEVYTNITRRV